MKTNNIVNRMFTNTIKNLFCVAVFLFLLTGYILPQYTVNITNASLVNSKTYEFDVTIKSTGASFTLTTYQCAIGFNAAIKNGGTLSFSYNAGSSGLGNLPTNGVGLNNVGGTEKFTFASNVGSDIITTTTVKVGRFRITNSNTFGSATADLTWDFTAGTGTIMTDGSYNDITVPSNFNDLNSGQLLPVELSKFNTKLDNNSISLNWETVTEVNVWGFEIQRSLQTADKSSDWEKIGFIEGKRNSNTTQNYSFKDFKVSKAGIYKYKLKMIDIDGSYTFSKESEITKTRLESFQLSQNYPNPFNPSTKIAYSVNEPSQISLTIYNAIGELVATLVNNQQDQGDYEVVWNASNLASGIYIYRFEATPQNGGNFYSAVKKMQLIK